MIISLSTRLQRWIDAGLIDKPTAKKIQDYESSRGGLTFTNGLFGVGGLAILLGIAAIISVNWAHIPPHMKLVSHFVLNLIVFKVLIWCLRKDKKGILIELLAGGFAGLTLTFIMLTGQVYQSQEPVWKALALWLVLVSPFLFVITESRFLIRGWIIAFLMTYGLFIVDNVGDNQLLKAISVTLPPFVMIAVGQNTSLRKWRELWGINISYTGFFLIAVLVSAAQMAWRNDVYLHNDLHRDILWQTAGITMLAALILIGWRHARLIVPMAKSVDIFLPLSVVIGFLPLLIDHGNWPVAGAGIEMGYWAFCGWLGLVTGIPRAMNIAISLIALRLFGVYIEVFGTLAETGIGLIVSGVLLIALVYGTRRLIARLPKKLRKVA